MKNNNYLNILQNSRNASKFNMIYEAIMKDLEIYKNVKSNNIGLITNKNLNLILEEIEKPQYLVCESSGKTILLEDAIFMDEDFLISEGILDKVGEKIQQLIEWITEGIKSVLSKGSDIIKAFCEKVKNNKVVASIRKKLNLDEKLSIEKFKKFVNVKAGGKSMTAESILDKVNTSIISEATKLTKKEEAITDPNELKPLIQKYEDALSGKKVLKNAKTDQPLSKKYIQDRLRLLKRKMESLQSGSNNQSKSEESSEQNASNTQDKQQKNVSSNEKSSENKYNSYQLTNNKKSVGDIYFNVEGIKNVVVSVKDESFSKEAINTAAKDSAVAIGGAEAVNVVSGDTPAPAESTEEPKKEKKGFFGKLKDKVSDAANKAGNKLKDKIKSGIEGAKKWFNAQNKWVKILICCIIAVLAILALYFLITIVIYPILYGILNGGIVNAVAGVFRIYVSGKTFVATYKQGKKSWETGEGWAKTFLLIGGSIFAIVNLGQMAAQGNAMMAADQAKNAVSAAREGAKEAVGNAGAEGYSVSIGDEFKTSSGIKFKIDDLGDSTIMKGGTLKFTMPDGTVGTRTISSNFFSDCSSNADIQLKLSKLGKAMLKQYNDVNSSPGTF